MKKIIYSSMPIMCMCLCATLTSYHGVSPDADEEAVLTKKPWFCGHGGVEEEPVTTGNTWCWWSTSAEYFKIIPISYYETLDDIISNENTPLDFKTQIVIRIKPEPKYRPFKDSEESTVLDG